MATQNPQVSVIIPTYNRSDQIQATIESVLNQTYTNYVLIIIDDASTDGTADWIAKNYPDIWLSRLPQNCGPAGARNVGIKLTDSDLIAFLDHDDQWLPSYLEAQVKTLQENPHAVLVFCNYLESKKGSYEVNHDVRPLSIYQNMTHHLLMENIIHTMSTVVIRREVLLQAGLLNDCLKICHDRELYLRLLYLGEAVHVSHTLVIKVVHSNNLVGNYRLWAKEAQMLLDIFFEDPRSQPYKHLKAEAKSYWAFKLAKWMWRSHHDVLFTLAMMLRAFQFHPRLTTQKIWQKLRLILKLKQ